MNMLRKDRRPLWKWSRICCLIFLFQGCGPVHDEVTVPPQEPPEAPAAPAPIHPPLEARDLIPADSLGHLESPTAAEARALLGFLGRRIPFPEWREQYYDGLFGAWADLLEHDAVDADRPVVWALTSRDPWQWIGIIPADTALEEAVRRRRPDWFVAAVQSADLIVSGNDRATVDAIVATPPDTPISPPASASPRWQGAIAADTLLAPSLSLVNDIVEEAYPSAMTALQHVFEDLEGSTRDWGKAPTAMDVDEASTRIHIRPADGGAEVGEAAASYPFAAGWCAFSLRSSSDSLPTAIAHALAAATGDRRFMERVDALIHQCAGPVLVTLASDSTWCITLSTRAPAQTAQLLQSTLPPHPAASYFDLGGIGVLYALVGETAVCYTVQEGGVALASGPSAEPMLLAALEHFPGSFPTAPFFTGQVDLTDPLFDSPLWPTSAEEEALWRSGLSPFTSIAWYAAWEAAGPVVDLDITWGPPVDLLGAE